MLMDYSRDLADLAYCDKLLHVNLFEMINRYILCLKFITIIIYISFIYVKLYVIFKDISFKLS